MAIRTTPPKRIEKAEEIEPCAKETQKTLQFPGKLRLTRKDQPTTAKKKAEKDKQKAAGGLRRGAQKAKNVGILIKTLRSPIKRKITKLRGFCSHF